VTYRYDDSYGTGVPSGKLIAVDSSVAGSLITNVDYGHLNGNPTEVDWGNGFTTTYDYGDPLYRLAGITTKRGTESPVQDLDYAYGATGGPVNSPDIYEINDHVLNEDLFYHYDVHDRLTAVTSGGFVLGTYPTIASYTYGTGADAGKMTSKDEGGQVSFQFNDPNHVHAVSGTSTGEALTYDKAGSISARVGGETYTFDAENRMTQIASYPTATSYLYDGQGNLAIRGTAASPRTSAIDDRTVYVGGVYEERSEYGIGINAKATVLYQALGRVIATRTGTETTYLLADHLGSTVGTVSADGNEVHQVRYWPYGAVRSGSVGTDRMYTGQQKEADSALGAYFYHARFYSTTLGQFISPDNLVPSSSGSGLNRYSYSYNNPIRLSDPNGHDPCGAQGQCAVPLPTPSPPPIDPNWACANDMASCLWWSAGGSGLRFIQLVAQMNHINPLVLAAIVWNEIENLNWNDSLPFNAAEQFAAGVKDYAESTIGKILSFVDPLSGAAQAALRSGALDDVLGHSIGPAQLNPLLVKNLEDEGLVPSAGSWSVRTSRLLDLRWSIIYAGAFMQHLSISFQRENIAAGPRDFVISYRWEGEYFGRYGDVTLNSWDAADEQWKNVGPKIPSAILNLSARLDGD
jgi:RHS repeat-associated protein